MQNTTYLLQKKKLDVGAICILRSHIQGKQKITLAQFLC
jgi:hypothetical protein